MSRALSTGRGQETVPLPSISTYMQNLRMGEAPCGILSDCVNPRETGRHWLRKTRRVVRSPMQTRAWNDRGRFVGVSCYDLMKDPMAELRRMCRRAGIGFDNEAEREAERCMRANPRNRFGWRACRLDDFGLSWEIVDEAFSSCREKHENPIE